MAGAEKTYVEEMAKGLGYFGALLPTPPLRRGDYGLFMDKYKFIRIGNIRDLNIEFQVRDDPKTSSIQYESSNAVVMSVSVSADANLPNAPLTTKVDFSFNRENAVVFKANDVQAESIQDQAKLGSEILNLLSSG